tara:strand:+ start:1408 stop:1644 length:237 start_codon:yes stop_codon:yes gene_type:complete
MRKIVLPQDLSLNQSKPVQVYDYQSSQELSKQQVVLNQNAFSFLTEGTKEVFFEDQQVKGYRFYQLDLGIEAVVNKAD